MKANSLIHPDPIGVFLGIVSILLACVFYVRAKEQVKPRVLIERTTLVGKSERLFPESVEIRYNDKVIPMLSKVHIIFWNAGRKTLNDSDVATNDPIAIKFPESEARVLDIRSITTTRDVINAKVTLDRNIIYLSFDFLERNDGLSLEAFFDSGSQAKVTLCGTIKGVRKGIATSTRDSFVQLAIPHSSGDGLAVGSLVPLVVGVAAAIRIITGSGKLDYIAFILAIGAGSLGLAMLISGIYGNFHGRTPRPLRQTSQIIETDEVDHQPPGLP